MKEQIPLEFPLRSQATFENFIVERNGELVTRLHGLVEASRAQTIWIWGEHGTGCSHLLYASCHLLHQNNSRVAYIPSQDWNLHSDSLVGYQDFDIVAIDDVELWLNRQNPESELVELYQAIQNSNAILLLSAARPPAQYEYVLDDLKSRFNASECYQVMDLSDRGKIEYVQSQAKQRGIELEDGVARFMLTRCSRYLPDLLAMLNTLDNKSLALQRKITIPFLKHVLGL